MVMWHSRRVMVVQSVPRSRWTFAMMELILSVFRSGAANIPILRSVALTQTGIGIALQRLIAAINGVKPISPAVIWSVQAASRASAPFPISSDPAVPATLRRLRKFTRNR